ncbi:peptidoglycan-binding protein LysM [Campylobacter geochelonis]|uniref:peptidoglycan-binding protein LysM n=1 Tax=Campylobacter geochelonis TaxID=1780362 RepID=UPI00077094EC|nr:peptidoglycan-binding protein LysM [Campylobacter geochelonis]CZE46752.1 LysM domain/BON superfamily protein [Campylobacter geochelonis]CZE50322.1 LysM domain/BON superfamily protein [Campylobacter geochelonis]
MGLLSFAIDAGKKLLGLGDDEGKIKEEIKLSNQTMPIENLEVKVEGDTVILKGDGSQEAKEKAALIAGNIEGIKKVEFEGVRDESDENYYEIQKGDNLSKISKKFYGNPNLYNKIFEANREVIKDMDLIYPGQKIRIPKLEK